ncbi:hypothetical protein BHM03_00036973, partial [Ensete ventricosum]
MYRSARLPVCGLPATEQYRQNRSSVIDFDRRQSIKGEKGKKKKKRKRRKKRRRKNTSCRPRLCAATALARGLPVRFFSHAGRKIKA